MNIIQGRVEYKTEKAIPCEALFRLFLAVGWATEDTTTPPHILNNFNIAFIHSTFVFSAWMDDQLVGCVRVLSDLHFRSVIYDFAVLPEYQRKGIGRTLIQKCIEACPDSEWLVQTDQAEEFYKKVGFTVNNDCFLTIPCKCFR